MQKMYERKNVGKIIIDLSMEPKPKPATPVKTKGKDKVVKITFTNSLYLLSLSNVFIR